MLFGISGKISSGKDSLAECLQVLNPKLNNVKFATKLKQIAAMLTGFQDQWSYAGKQTWLQEWGMSVGEFQQRLGTEAVRNGLHQNAWVLGLFSDYVPGASMWIVTDVRFPNEVEAIKQRGGYLIRIDGARTQDARDPNHISETALDDWQDWDYRFDNSTLTHGELFEHAIDIYSLVLRGK